MNSLSFPGGLGFVWVGSGWAGPAIIWVGFGQDLRFHRPGRPIARLGSWDVRMVPDEIARVQNLSAL